MERGKGTKSALSEIEEKYGLKTTAIVTMAEVVEHLYNKEYKGKVIQAELTPIYVEGLPHHIYLPEA